MSCVPQGCGFSHAQRKCKLLFGLGLLLLGTLSLAAPPEPQSSGGGGPVRLTVEVTWRISPTLEDGSPLDLELTEGQAVEALIWPSGVCVGLKHPAVRGWRLGTERSGRVRIRIEAPTGASLVFRLSDQVVRVPILAVLEGPQRTPCRRPGDRRGAPALGCAGGRPRLGRRYGRAGGDGPCLDRFEYPDPRGDPRGRALLGRAAPDPRWRAVVAE